jgi:DNA adenine methylase
MCPKLAESIKPVEGSLPLKWHGGKFYLADKIIKMFPDHKHYVEPYFGGGAVLFRKPCEGVSEVVNDLNRELMNFWHVLASPEWYEIFVRWCEATPFDEHYWEHCNIHQSDGGNEVVRAWRFFVRYRQSRQGLGKDFATLSRNRTRRGMNEQVSSWLSAVDGLPECHARLKRVVILNHRALDVIKEQDGPNTLFYLDPPYLQETRTAKWAFGDYEMSEADHVELLENLACVKGKFLLSGYHSGIYDSYAVEFSWNFEEISIPNNASSAKEKRVMTECVWRNW